VDSESPSVASRWALVRVPVGRGLRIELLSGDWIRLSTHFARRTFLCTGEDDCPLCEFLPSRPFWYLPVLLVPGSRPALLELSGTASADLEQVSKLAFGRLGAGCVFDVSRRASKKAARAEAVSEAPAQMRVSLQRWGTALMAIYGLPQFNEGEGLESYGDRTRTKVYARAEMIAARLRAGVRT
jgi:hypothetical protein